MPAGYYSTTGTGDTWRGWTDASTTTTTYTDRVWSTWTDAGTGSSTATTTATTTNVWEYWTTGTATTTVTDDVWVTWTTDSTGAVTNVRRTATPPRPYTPPQRTPEQIRAQEARQEALRLERVERERKRREAEARANELLLDCLTQEQKGDMERDGFFFVDSKRPGRRYRLRNGRVGNVDVLEGGKVTHRLCAHPAPNVPDGDTRLAQKLMLEHQEDVFLSRANRHPARH